MINVISDDTGEKKGNVGRLTCDISTNKETNIDEEYDFRASSVCPPKGSTSWFTRTANRALATGLHGVVVGLGQT